MALSISANINGTIPNVAYNDIYLNSQGNIALTSDLGVSGNQQAVLQACAQAAKTLLGEIVFNTDVGIPYFETIWIGVPNLQQYKGALTRAFLTVPDVVEVVSLIVSSGTAAASDVNTLTYSAVIRTVYGSGGISG